MKLLIFDTVGWMRRSSSDCSLLPVLLCVRNFIVLLIHVLRVLLVPFC